MAASWRLAVSAPAEGGRVGSAMTVCYEVTGSGRQPALAFEVTALPPESPTGATPIRVDATSGRGSVQVPLTSVRPGRYHLRIQLLVNGQPVDGAAVTVPSVTLAPDVPPAICP